MFAPLDQTGRVEAVTRRLVDAITLGLFADGEQLPTEAELAGQFGVSTVT
ncbi:GntR family transcriptional regulator, partial [Saccharopolyspora oryzae]